MNKQSIVVVEAGFVFIGVIAHHDNKELRLTEASVVRKWGTTKGLGQLALSGPTKDTVLDPCGEARVNPSKVLYTLPCTY